MKIEKNDYIYHARKAYMEDGAFCLHGLNGCYRDMCSFKMAVVNHYEKKYDRKEYIGLLGGLTEEDQLNHVYNLGHITGLPNIERVNGVLKNVPNNVKITKGDEIVIFKSILHAIVHYSMSRNLMDAFLSHALFVNGCTKIEATSESEGLIDVDETYLKYRIKKIKAYLEDNQESLNNQV